MRLRLAITAPLIVLLMVLLQAIAFAEEAYRFQAGDVLNITVAPQAAFGRTVTVQPDGKVNYPVAGELTAAGLTISEFTTKLVRGLEKELNNPQVTVSLQSSAPKLGPQITVLGAVREPGLFDLREGWRLTEGLATAGGPSPTADLTRVTLARKDRSALTLDFSSSALGKTPEENPLLRDGDLIVIAEKPVVVIRNERSTVAVLGEVARPGAYELREGMTVLELLTVAGGLTTKADIKKIGLLPKDAKEPKVLDLNGLLRGNAEAANTKLAGGDTLTIPANPNHAVVIGEVAQQGDFTLEGGETALDLLVKAGGPSASADLGKATIIRRRGEGKIESLEIDLKKLTRKNPGKAPAIESGDLLFIPTRDQRQRNSWLQYLGPLSVLFNVGAF